MFKVISVGWQCEDWLGQTLQSIKQQSRQDWEVHITYDQSDDQGAAKIAEWVDAENKDGQRCRWGFYWNPNQMFAVRNQYEGIKALAPADDDIIVFLDLDGDMLAHSHVLDRLAEAYSDDTLLTYGSYKPVPDPGTCQPAVPFPPEVIANNSYRQHILNGGACSFNHLRTMKGKVFNAMPPERFHWGDGRWYDAGTDYLFMVMGLELAGHRHKCIEETLLLYNHANPLADNVFHPEVSRACTTDILNQPPLSPL